MTILVLRVALVLFVLVMRGLLLTATTLDAICRALDCQPGDLLRWVPNDDGADAG